MRKNQKGAPVQRSVETPEGVLVHTLERKRVKNRNLRVLPDGQVRVSIPQNGTADQADAFVLAKYQWIRRAQERLYQTKQLPPEPPRAEAAAALHRALQEVYPLVASYGVLMPELKVRRMRSQWGNCHWRQGYITLNLALARCPVRLQRYVALHELVHFLEQNHGPGFYAYMDRLMPQWRQYRAELKTFVAALREETT